MPAGGHVTITPAPAFTVTSAVQEDLIGLQFGLARRWEGAQLGLGDGVFIDGAVSGGLMYSDASATGGLASTLINIRATGQDQAWTGLLEAQLGMGAEISPGVTLSGGLNFLGLSSVAPASSQLQGANFITSTVSVQRSAVHYFGIYLGAEWVF